MDHEIIDEFKEIIRKVNKYFEYQRYSTNFSNGIHVTYLYEGYYYVNNLLNMFNDLLTTKIYKYKNTYWSFSNLYDINVTRTETHTTLKFSVNVNIIEELDSYFNYLPRDMVALISQYLDVFNISNYCNYIHTWYTVCDENFYRSLYIIKFNNFYNFIREYLQYDTSTWQERYTSLLWEDINSIEELSRVFQFRISRNKHIAFILEIYDFVYNQQVNVSKMISLYHNNVEFLNYLIRTTHRERIDQIKKKLITLNRRDFADYIDSTKSI